MMKKMMKLWMYLIFFAAFISSYAHPVYCDFEEYSCSWSIEGFRRISDNHLETTDIRNDIMHRNGSEWYLLFDATSESYATLNSTQTTIEGLQCLNIWYIYIGSLESQIQVIVQSIVGDNVLAISKPSTSNPGWRRFTVEIDVSYNWQVTILIRGITGPSHSKIGIDDIVLKPESCLDCNFLDGLCNWEGKEWNVPSQVNYAVTEFKSTKEQSVLISGFDIYPGEKCFSFKYQIKDFRRECIFIEVYSNDGISWSPVWSSERKHALHGWNEVNVTINVGKKSKIVIRFQPNNCFNVTYYISSISLKNQSCTGATKTFKTSPSIVNPTDIATFTATTTVNTSSNYGKRATTTFKTSPSIVNPTDIATFTVTTIVNTSWNYGKNGVIIGIVIGGLAFTVAMLLIVIYLYRRCATSPNANVSKYNTVSGVTYSGATRPTTDNADASRSIDRHNQTSETVPYSTALGTQPRQRKTQHGVITGTLNIHPCQAQLLDNDISNVTSPEHTQNQYHQSADTDGANSYDTVHDTDNHTTEFRDDTYDCTTIHPTTIPDPTYDHLNFKEKFDSIYDHATSGTLNKDMGYLDHSCDTTLQRSMQDVDPTYDHITK